MKQARAASPIVRRRDWRPCLRRTLFMRDAASAGWLPLALLWRRQRAALAPAPITNHRHTVMVMTTKLDLHFHVNWPSAGTLMRGAPRGAAAVPGAPRGPGAAAVRAISPAATPAETVFRTIAPHRGAPALNGVRSDGAIARSPGEKPVWRSAHCRAVVDEDSGAGWTALYWRRERTAASFPDRAHRAETPAMLVYRTARVPSAPARSEVRSPGSPVRTAPTRMPPLQLVWRETNPAAAQTQAATDIAFAAASTLAAAPAASLQSASGAARVAAAAPDRAAVDRIAREVIGRVEKHIRIERERRGI